MLLTMPVAAQQNKIDEAQKKLEAQKRQLTETDRKAGEIQTEMGRLKDDTEKLNADRVRTAKLIQASEAQLSAIEQRIGELEIQESHVRGSLEKKRGSMSGLLAAMQRMGRNPPPVMVTRREDALAMVRSAMLIAAAFPELRGQAVELSDKLSDLVRVTDNIKAEKTKLAEENQRLRDEQLRLASLAEAKKASLAALQPALAQIKRASNEARQSVSDQAELIAKMDRAVAESTRLGEYEKQLAAQQAAAAAAAAAAPTTVAAKPVEATAPPATPAPETPPKQIAANDPPPAPKPPAPKLQEPKPEPKQPGAILAPNDRFAMASPGRIQPSIPFADAKGRLPMPVQGRRVVNFGEKSQRGPFQGIAIETRFGAQVTSPADGWVVYAGEFRSYGQILIINAGGGYHILLANMSQIDAQQGQFMLAGEPVGTMAAAPRGVTPGKSQQDGAPLLYIEFKKDQKSIDPDPWWAEPPKKNAALDTRPKDG